MGREKENLVEYWLSKSKAFVIILLQGQGMKRDPVKVEYWG